MTTESRQAIAYRRATGFRTQARNVPIVRLVRHRPTSRSFRRLTSDQVVAVVLADGWAGALAESVRDADRVDLVG